jgi:hypothetical protein
LDILILPYEWQAIDASRMPVSRSRAGRLARLYVETELLQHLIGVLAEAGRRLGDAETGPGEQEPGVDDLHILLPRQPVHVQRQLRRRAARCGNDAACSTLRTMPQGMPAVA